MLIILEGPDGSGKTTLLNKFLNKGYICKRGLRYEKPKWSRLHSMSNNADIIIDRSFVSDMVYRVVQGGKPEDINLYEALPHLDKDVIIVHCKTTKMFETSMSRGEDNITDSKTAKKISDTYDVILKLFSIFTDVNVVNYDFRKADCFETLLKDINEIKEVQNGN